jgi:hypothetical protein
MPPHNLPVFIVVTLILLTAVLFEVICSPGIHHVNQDRLPEILRWLKPLGESLPDSVRLFLSRGLWVISVGLLVSVKIVRPTLWWPSVGLLISACVLGATADDFLGASYSSFDYQAPSGLLWIRAVYWILLYLVPVVLLQWAVRLCGRLLENRL